MQPSGEDPLFGISFAKVGDVPENAAPKAGHLLICGTEAGDLQVYG